MLKGMKNCSSYDGLITMEHALYEFYLTGSWAFGTQTEKSDFDFFVQDSEGIRKWLEENGFKKYLHTVYISDDIVDVYDNKECNIHVQIVTNADYKAIVQRAIKRTGIFKIIKSKSIQKYIWDLGFSVLRLKDNNESS